jgi:hypothetical protein
MEGSRAERVSIVGERAPLFWGARAAIGETRGHSPRELEASA